MTIEEVDERINMKFGILLEQMDDRFKLFLENIDALIVKKLQPLTEDITELKIDMKVVKAVVQDTNKDIRKLEKRVVKLEARISK